MLNGKTSFDIPNVPADYVLLRFNVLFAFIYDILSGGKGMTLLKIDPSKTHTIIKLMNNTFPAIDCFDNEKLPIVTPKTVGYIHALVIDCISIAFDDSINARALEHENAMVDAYTKMKPDSFKSQLQAVLTTYYEDIKGILGASGCSKPKVVKRKFEDQADNAGNEDAAADHADVAAASQHAASSPPQASAAAAPSAEGGGGDEGPAAAAATPPGKGRKGKNGRA